MSSLATPELLVPTSPPIRPLLAPPVTGPVAYELSILPLLVPTRPPNLPAVADVEPTAAADMLCEIVPVPELTPATPPASPAKLLPVAVTAPVVHTPLIVPLLSPTSTPTSIFPVTPSALVLTPTSSTVAAANRFWKKPTRSAVGRLMNSPVMVWSLPMSLVA